MILTAAACGEPAAPADDARDAGASSADDGSGSTWCGLGDGGPVVCSPGQLCVDSVTARCVPGCTSDVQCGEDHCCVRLADAGVGECQHVISPLAFDAGPGPSDGGEPDGGEPDGG